MPTIDIQYFKEDSFVHRLHPFTKIIFEIAVLVTAAAFNEPLFLAAEILAIIGVAALAKIPARKFRYMWVLLYIVLFMVITQGVWFTSFGDFGDIDAEFEWLTLFHRVASMGPGRATNPGYFRGSQLWILFRAKGGRYLACVPDSGIDHSPQRPHKVFVPVTHWLVENPLQCNLRVHNSISVHTHRQPRVRPDAGRTAVARRPFRRLQSNSPD